MYISKSSRTYILLCSLLSSFQHAWKVMAQGPPPYFHVDLFGVAECSELEQGFGVPYVPVLTEAECQTAFTTFLSPGLGFATYDGPVTLNTKAPGCIVDFGTGNIAFNTASPGDPASSGSSKVCQLQSITNSGGDPHFIGFNQKTITYQGECTLILVQSKGATASGDDVAIHVRTTRKLDFSYISGVAMMIGDDVIEVKPNADIVINGAVMSNDNSVSTTMSGLPFAITKTYKGSKNKIVSYTFDIGNQRVIDVQANIKRSMMFVRTKGTFPSETQGMLGTPGNLEMMSRDGIKLTDQDVNAYGESWQVKDTDVQLFQERLGPQYPEKCLYEDAPGATAQLRGRRKLLVKKTITVEEATLACKDVVSANKRKLCVEDTIAMGDLEVKDDPFYSNEE